MLIDFLEDFPMNKPLDPKTKSVKQNLLSAVAGCFVDFFGNLKQNLLFAVAAFFVGFGVIWLHDALVLGAYLPSSGMALVSGIGTCLMVLIATMVSSSKSFSLILIVVFILAIVFLPMKQQALENFKSDTVTQTQTPTVVQSREVPATVQPEVVPDVVKPEVTAVPTT